MKDQKIGDKYIYKYIFDYRSTFTVGLFLDVQILDCTE